MTAPALLVTPAVGLLLVAAWAGAPRRQRAPAWFACGAVGLAGATAISTLRRGGAGAQAHQLGLLLLALGGVACGLALAVRLLRHSGRRGLAVLAVALCGARLAVPGVRLEAAPAADDPRWDEEPWITEVRHHLVAAAAGLPERALAAAGIVARQGADVATLRALCPVSARKLGHGPASLGHASCVAVQTALPENGAQGLRCGSDPGSHLGEGTVRCHLAAQLLAEAGLLDQAEQALAKAESPGPWQVLWQARGLPVPKAVAARSPSAPQGLPPGLVWPRGSLLGPGPLGFTLFDAPGTLTWHPGAGALGARRGVLWAQSRYPGALVTAVPAPATLQAACGMRCLVSGGPDLAITLEGASHATVYRCPSADGQQAEGPGEGLLPRAACNAAATPIWVHLAPNLGPRGILQGRLHGSYLLAHWAWLPAPEEP